MSRTTLAAVLFTAAGCAMSAPASAVTQSRVQIETGSNMCTLSVPTIDSKIRPRANGFKNEGTTNQFVICSFDAPPGAYYINGTAFSAVYLWLISLDGVARSVTCTGVNSLPGTGIIDPVFVPKTLSVASTSDWTEYAWAPADFGGTSTIPFSSGAFSVTCVLPPNVSIVAGEKCSSVLLSSAAQEFMNCIGDIPDPEVDALILELAAQAGIQRRTVTEDEIIERTQYALINEGAKILAEGIALRAVDIDIIYLNGYGYPAWRGGPMWYADTVGLKKVYDRVCEFHAQHGALWEPAALLKELAEAGRTFAEFDRAKVAA